MANLKPWYRVEGCQPREDLRLNKPLNEADFAVNLDHIKRGDSHPDYVKPHLFFARTFMTKALRELAAGTIRRLGGEQSETAAVYNMATQFGGGKTHALATLYHLANGGSAARDWPGVDQILTDAGVQSVPKAAVAVVVGTEFDPLTGRQDGNGPVRKTLWGEIAWQLGGEKSFAVVAEHEAKGMAPGGDVIRKMLPQGPSLILLDEVINYMNRARVVKLAEQSRTFIFNLAEAARALSGVVVCVSVPKSAILEVTAADQEDYEAIKHDLNRLGKAIMMSAELEISEIIRRRLFDWKGLPKEGELAAQEYAAWVRENAGALTGVDPDRAYEQFKAAYPFHPATLSVFERKWQSLPRFQRTRGVLRLLALWVARAFQEDHRQQYPDAVIGLGSAPLDDPRFRAALFEQLGSADLEGPATTDIAGSSNAHSIRLDKEATEAIRTGRLHQKVATAIFLESNGGHLKMEATLGEIKSAAGGPGVNMADIDHVLDGLVSNCYYLNTDRNRYRFSITPNINKILTDRRASVQPKQTDDLLRKEIEAAFRVKVRDCDLDVRPFPERSNDVPDRPVLTIVVLHPERQSDTAATNAFIEKIVKDCGNGSRTFKSAVVFVTADSITAMRDNARDVLAWREIDEDADTKSRLDEGQRRQLAVNVGASRKALEESIWRAYRHVYLLNGENALRQIDLGIVTRSQSGSPTENLIQRLRSDDIVTDAPSSAKLLRWWPPAVVEWTTRAVRDAFFTTPALSRLRQPDAIRRTIADGVSKGEFGYARRSPSGAKLVKNPGDSLAEHDVEISEDVCILKAQDAQKLVEPPRLVKLTIDPHHSELRPGEIAVFRMKATDQYGHSIDIGEPQWSVPSGLGGTVDQTGKFVAGPDLGLFSVIASKDGIEGSARIQIVARRSDSRDDAQRTDEKSRISWSGAVPAQKWMKFYTTVVSRFANTPGLRISVSFTVPSEGEDSKVKAEETRAALKELGLDDSVANE